MSTRRKKKYNKCTIAGFLLFFLVTFYFIYNIIKTQGDINLVQDEISITQVRVDKLRNEQEKLETERRKLDDIKYIEKLARDNYNMVKKNEVPLFIVESKIEKQKETQTKE